MAGYQPGDCEKKWQQMWRDHRIFTSDIDVSKPKFYVLDMFPYPSGEGLHVGHPEGYTATDIVARYKRAAGFNVLHPMGWDAFGLPAEQYAIKTDTHPAVITRKNIDRFRAQLQAIGFSYDWQREVNTTDPEYYRWTQWIFLQLYDTWFDVQRQQGRPITELVAEFESGIRPLPESAGEKSWIQLDASQQRRVLEQYRLAYQIEAPVNWCPALGTVLANEEVIDGKSEVGGFPVERRPMRQWMLRITDYAQRLLDGLDSLEWPESLKMMQRNWIGRSEGALVRFDIAQRDDVVTVFTTRPDTLYGATYIVLAPEHPLVALNSPHCIVPAIWPTNIPACWRGDKVSPREAVESYQKTAAARSERQRQEDTSKTGAFTGAYAVNPVNQEHLPIFISDYVLMGYGTGAIMAVPAHDQRDFDFARSMNLPIRRVVSAAATQLEAGDLPLESPGFAVNSPEINGLATAAAKARMCALLEQKSLGTRQINYKIRDWLFSRQRYWGEPFPIVHLEDGTTVPLADSQLPLLLPEVTDFKPTGTLEPPLSKATSWHQVQVVLEGSPGHPHAHVVPTGTPGAVCARREVNTMPQWAGSCWYYLRYIDPHNRQSFCAADKEKYWMAGGVDLYVGGVEHAVLHLLYSRFWHKVLYDRGLVGSPEPFRKLVNQGLILGEAEYTVFTAEDGRQVSAAEIDPEFSTRVGSDGRSEIISRHKSTGSLVIGRACDPAAVEKRGNVFVLKADPNIELDARSFKMSKSRGNVVNPDDVIAEYGADSLRLFEMFMGPLEQVKPWSTAGVEGVYRFLQRLWRNLLGGEEGVCRVVRQTTAGTWTCGGRELNATESAAAARDATAILRPTHRVIRKVTEDIERLAFNTAISAMMEFNNALAKLTFVPMESALHIVRILEPFAPHIAEELYHQLAGVDAARSITMLPWPRFDEALCVDEQLEIPVQINGKLAGRVRVPADCPEARVLELAVADPLVAVRLAQRTVKKKIYIKGRMINLVV
ncbi:MAG: leucine--tRNA ligase [Planctomycetes bacterium]|nr:leucine--tRNA ligase [Planctomycetota bacterium]